MKKKIVALMCVTALAGSLVACGGNTKEAAPKEETPKETVAEVATEAEKAPADGKVYEIKLTATDGATTLWNGRFIETAKRIYDRTNGCVDIQFHGNGEMLVYAEGVEAVMSDAAVMYFTDPSMWVDYCPVLMTLNAPYLFENYQEVEAFCETDLYKELLAESEAAGVHAVSPIISVGTRHTLADRPITKVEDFKGLSIRVPSSTIFTDTFAALGTNYQGLPFADVHNAMETGMITAVEIVPGNVIATRPDQSMKGDKYYSLTGHFLNTLAIYCGSGFWNSLPEEYQQIITEEFAAVCPGINADVEAATAAEIETVKSYGVEIVEVPDKSSFQAAVADMNSKMERWDDISSTVYEIRESLK